MPHVRLWDIQPFFKMSFFVLAVFPWNFCFEIFLFYLLSKCRRIFIWELQNSFGFLLLACNFMPSCLNALVSSCSVFVFFFMLKWLLELSANLTSFYLKMQDHKMSHSFLRRGQIIRKKYLFHQKYGKYLFCKFEINP